MCHDIIKPSFNENIKELTIVCYFPYYTRLVFHTEMGNWNGKLIFFFTLHFPHSAFSTLRIFHTPHFLHSAFSTLRIFYTPHFPHSAFSTLRTPHSALRTPHSALRTPHSALRTPHSALRTPHSALRTPHIPLNLDYLQYTRLKCCSWFTEVNR